MPVVGRLASSTPWAPTITGKQYVTQDLSSPRGRLARIIHEDCLALSPGTRLGPYQIQAAIELAAWGTRPGRATQRVRQLPPHCDV